jgi:predicted negative regulator of RcsB-dependent stress response
MATHYDLEEQEQLAQIKHFWARYGNLITWALILVLAGFAAWNGWQYWQRRTALEAATLYDELQRAADANDLDKVKRAWADLQSRAGSTAQAHHGALRAAQVMAAAKGNDEARQALRHVIDQSKDDALVALARLRLVGLALDDKQLDEARTLASLPVPPALEGLRTDRLGDVHMAAGQPQEARSAYLQAYAALADTPDLRRLVEAKLNALGIDPAQSGTKP